MPIKDFKFAKSLMQEHFNEKYMESEKYPKATFQGKLTGYDMKKSGVQDARAQGKLTVHGVTAKGPSARFPRWAPGDLLRSTQAKRLDSKGSYGTNERTSVRGAQLVARRAAGRERGL